MMHFIEIPQYQTGSKDALPTVGILNLSRVLFASDRLHNDPRLATVSDYIGAEPELGPGKICVAYMDAGPVIVGTEYARLKASVLAAMSKGAPFSWLEVASVAEADVKGDGPIRNTQLSLLNLDRVQRIFPFSPLFTLVEFDNGRELYVGAPYDQTMVSVRIVASG